MTTPDTYCGWSVRCDPPPIPVRTCDWVATHPDYAGPDTPDMLIYAGSRAELAVEIDDWYEERTK